MENGWGFCFFIFWVGGTKQIKGNFSCNSWRKLTNGTEFCSQVLEVHSLRKAKLRHIVFILGCKDKKQKSSFCFFLYFDNKNNE
jgi:hypothetical protein